MQEEELRGDSLHLLCLGLLLGQVFLHAVVQHRAHAKRLVSLDKGLDGLVVLPCYELPVESHLHHLLKGLLAKDLLANVHQLRNRKKRRVCVCHLAEHLKIDGKEG